MAKKKKPLAPPEYAFQKGNRVVWTPPRPRTEDSSPVPQLATVTHVDAKHLGYSGETKITIQADCDGLPLITTASELREARDHEDTVRDRIKSGYYKVHEPHPAALHKPKQPDYKAPSEEHAKFAAAIKVFENAKSGYHQAVVAWRERLAVAETKFRDEALAEVGVPLDHPKTAKLYSLAWEHGHSHGYSEVMLHLEEFAELLDLEQTRVVIEVTGGVVSEVYSDDPGAVSVDVLDHDNLKDGDTPSEDREHGKALIEEVKDLQRVQY